MVSEPYNWGLQHTSSLQMVLNPWSLEGFETSSKGDFEKMIYYITFCALYDGNIRIYKNRSEITLYKGIENPLYGVFSSLLKKDLDPLVKSTET